MNSLGDAVIGGGTSDTSISLTGYPNYPVPFLAMIRHGGTLINWANYYTITGNYGGSGANIISVKWLHEIIVLFDITPVLILRVNDYDGAVEDAI